MNFYVTIFVGRFNQFCKSAFIFYSHNESFIYFFFALFLSARFRKHLSFFCRTLSFPIASFSTARILEDLARFLVQCCDGILRRKAEAFIFEYYLDCLEKEFGDDKTKVPYTLEQLKKAYKYSFIAQAFFIPSYEIALNATSDDASEIKEANHEFCVSKAFDALQDVDQILQGELKTFFEKYNC